MVDEAGDEDRLIARCRAGDVVGYGDLVLRYQDAVFNTLYRLLGNYEDARDATQETFMKAYRAMAGFRRDCKFTTWLYRIAVNTARSAQRRRRAAPPSVPLSSPDPSIRVPDPVAPGPDALEVVSQAERFAIVEEALQQLDAEQRQVIVLHEIDGCNYAEMAEILGCPRGTVKSRLHRARVELRRVVARFLKSNNGCPAPAGPEAGF